MSLEDAARRRAAERRKNEEEEKAQLEALRLEHVAEMKACRELFGHIRARGGREYRLYKLVSTQRRHFPFDQVGPKFVQSYEDIGCRGYQAARWYWYDGYSSYWRQDVYVVCGDGYLRRGCAPAPDKGSRVHGIDHRPALVVGDPVFAGVGILESMAEATLHGYSISSEQQAGIDLAGHLNF